LTWRALTSFSKAVCGRRRFWSISCSIKLGQTEEPATHVASIYIGIDLSDLAKLLQTLSGVGLGSSLLLLDQIDLVVGAIESSLHFLFLERKLLYRPVLVEPAVLELLIE
jgi:hypothetical protein